jgi:hypothetical protein
LLQSAWPRPASSDIWLRGLGFNNLNQLKTFLPRGFGETVVERDQFERRWTAFGRKESRRKLERVSRSQRMNAKKPKRVLADNFAGFDLVPSVSKLFQPIEGERGAFPVEQGVTLETGQG